MNEGGQRARRRGLKLAERIGKASTGMILCSSTVLVGREREGKQRESTREERKSREENNNTRVEGKRRKKNNVSMILAEAFPGRRDVITEIGGE